MNRTILFKGKRVDNGEWVEGCLINWHHKLNPRIIWFTQGLISEDNDGLIETNFEVNPETVCQFTELLDKNGKKIFEGDSGIFEILGVGKGTCIVCFENSSFFLNVEGQRTKMPLFSFNQNHHSIEIISNIHD